MRVLIIALLAAISYAQTVCSQECSTQFVLCIRINDYENCRGKIDRSQGPLGNLCAPSCTDTEEMAATNDESSSPNSGSTNPEIDTGSGSSSASSQPTMPTVCTEENQGRCECAQLQGFLDGTTTYTWWDSYGEQRCFTVYIHADTTLPAPILIVPQCYSQDRLSNGLFGRRDTTLTTAAARYEFAAVYVSTSNPKINDWRWGNDGIMSDTNNPCAREDGEDINYMHDLMDFFASDQATYDAQDIYFSGFSQNSMAAQYFGYCFRDRVKGAWNGGSSLVNIPSDIMVPKLEGQCTRSAYEEYGRDCLTTEPCTECKFFSINPYLGPNSRRWITCIMAYNDDNLAMPTVEAGQFHWNAAGHDTRVLRFTGGRGHRNAYNVYDWTVSCLGVRDACSNECEQSFTECMASQTGESYVGFETCIGQKQSLAGCTKTCAPTFNMINLSETPEANLMLGNWGKQTTPFDSTSTDNQVTDTPAATTDSATNTPFHSTSTENEITDTPAATTDSATNTDAPIVGGSDPEHEDHTSQWYRTYSMNGNEKLISRADATLKAFQPAMVLPQVALRTKSGCPHVGLVEGEYIHWSDLNAQADGSMIQLPENSVILISVGSFISDSTNIYGRIVIPASSSLIFDDPGVGEEISLDTLGIDVYGMLHIGSVTCRMDGKIRITLHGEYGNEDSTADVHLRASSESDVTVKSIVVRSEGRLDIHGTLFHPTWTRLAAHVPGAPTETSAPESRNQVIYLQDCVNWLPGQQILVTTTHHKDTRGYNFNEQRAIDSVQCVTVDGSTFGQLILETPLEFYHHAGMHEYQAEVALLSRNILIQGNEKSEPYDTSPLSCSSATYPESWKAESVIWKDYEMIPCGDTFLTGFGGHVFLMGSSRVSGTEFYRMGQTNILGRYPIHFHWNTFGSENAATDNSIHRSFYRGLVVHNTREATVSRNVGFDIIGHALYLESGVEEENVIEYNLMTHVHCIGHCVIFRESHAEVPATPNLLVPADSSASAYYISNPNNIFRGNAASGGWAGYQFPILSEPVDVDLRNMYSDDMFTPNTRNTNVFAGNSAHSSGWWTRRGGSIYMGGAFFFDDWSGQWNSRNGVASTSDLLVYSPGRVNRRAPNHYGEHSLVNTTLALVGGGMSGWMFRSDWTEFDGLEVHDFMDQPAFLLMEVWYNNFAVNCRSSNKPHIPNPSETGYQDRRYSEPQNHLNVFRAYDHLVKHIITDWSITNCGGENGNIWTQHASAFAPEINTISRGITYDRPYELRAQSTFFGSVFGCCTYGQFFRVWTDADGSLSLRGKPTYLGAAVGGRWWWIDDRPGKCESFSHWEFPMIGCDTGDRPIGYIEMHNPHRPKLADVQEDRKVFTGTMTHFGREGEILTGDLLANDYRADKSIPIGGENDIVGAHDHSVYGGWYYWSEFGTPVKLRIERTAMITGSTLILATSLPPGTPTSHIRIYAVNYEGRAHEVLHDYTPVSSLDQVRSDPGYDKFYHDTSTNTLYWRVIDVYVTGNGLVWMEEQNPDYGKAYERGGVSLENTYGNFATINVLIDCESSDGAYCDQQPTFRVPEMGCPPGHEPVAIDLCQCTDATLCEVPVPTMEPTLQPTTYPTLHSTTTDTTPTTGSPELTEEVSLVVQAEGVTDGNKQAMCDAFADALAGECSYVSLEGPSPSRKRRKLTASPVYMDIAVANAQTATALARENNFLSTISMPENTDVIAVTVTDSEEAQDDGVSDQITIIALEDSEDGFDWRWIILAVILLSCICCVFACVIGMRGKEENSKIASPEDITVQVVGEPDVATLNLPNNPDMLKINSFNSDLSTSVYEVADGTLPNAFYKQGSTV